MVDVDIAAAGPDLSRADITTKRPEKKKKGLRQISELGDRVEALQKIDAQVPPLPSGIGDEIMRSFALPPDGAARPHAPAHSPSSSRPRHPAAT